MNGKPLHELLRKPDFARQRTPKSLELWLRSGVLDVCRPFKPWALPADPAWNEDPYRDDTWGLYYHSLVWFSILDLGIDEAPEVADREACSARLKDLFTSYVRFLADTGEQDAHKMVWFDHSTAWRASTLAYVYERRLRGKLSPDEVAQLAVVVRQHDEKLKGFIASGRWKANNHGIFHAEALWDMAHVFSDVLDAQSTKTVALKAMRDVYSEMIDAEEGVCREHSLYYHLFDAWLLAQSATYMGGFGIDVIPGYRDVLRKMIDFYHRASPAERQLPAVGDTTFGRTSENPMLDEITKLVPDSAISEYLMGRGTSADRPAALTGFPRTGFYLFHDEAEGGPAKANFALVLDKPYMGAHAHVDGGSFTINLAGEAMLVDSGGPYAYGQKLRFNYFKAAEAHNVVLVDRKSSAYLTRVASQVSGPLGHGLRLVCDDLGGATWQRGFVDLGSGTYLVMDTLAADERRRFDALFRFAPGVRLEEREDGVIVANGTSARLFMQQAGNRALDRKVGPGGGETFPRSWVTRDLGHLEPAPIVATGFRAGDGWLATLLTTDESCRLVVHQMYSGRMLRCFVESAGSGRCIEFDVSDAGKPPKITHYRDFGFQPDAKSGAARLPREEKE
jgi:hypothetical protein